MTTNKQQKKPSAAQRLDELQNKLRNLYYQHADGLSLDAFARRVMRVIETDCNIDPDNLPEGCPLCGMISSHAHSGEAMRNL